MKQRMIISESEKRSILSLHESSNRRRYGLLTEATQEDITKFFTDQKSKFKNFPDGKVVPYKNGEFEFGYEVANADGTKYILIPNGRAVVDNGTGYKEQPNYTWTKSSFIDKLPIKPLQTIPLSTGQTTGTNPAGTTLAGVEPPSEKEIRQGYRQRVKDEKTSEKDRENKIKELENVINKYGKIYNNGNNPKMTNDQKTSYKNYIDSKKAELEKLKKTVTGTTNTTVKTPTPKCFEDRAIIDAGTGL